MIGLLVYRPVTARKLIALVVGSHHRKDASDQSLSALVLIVPLTPCGKNPPLVVFLGVR
jgi:hypothetical protein